MAIYTFLRLPRGINKFVPGHREVRNGKDWRSRIYYSYYNMIARCYYRGPHTEHHYRNRGIRVCQRWVVGEDGLTGFECFLRDLGPRPRGMTLDRINPNGHYTPENTRWASYKTQILNRRKRA